MNVLVKDFYRTIFRNFTKFLSILILSALGVMVFVGLKITTPIMQDSVFEKVKKQNLYDFKISSTYGFLREDTQIIDGIFDKFRVEYGYSVNVSDEKDFDFRLESRPEKISKINVVVGRDIEKNGEILLDKRLKEKYKVDDVINFKNFKFSSIFEGEVRELKTGSFKVVGFIESPEIGMKDYNESVENGYYAVILKDDFNFTNYNFVKLLSRELKDLEVNSDEYIGVKKNLKLYLQNLFKERPLEVYSVVYSEKRKKLDDSKKEIEDKKSDLKNFENEIEKSYQNLESGRKDIRTAYSNLEYQKNIFFERISENTKKVNEALKEIDPKFTEVDYGLKTLTQLRLGNISQSDAIEREIKGVESELDGINSSLNTLNDKYSKGEIYLSEYSSKKTEFENSIKEKKSTLEELNLKFSEKLKEREGYSQKISELESAMKELLPKKQELDESLKKIEFEKEQGIKKFDDFYQKILEKERRLKNGENKISDGKGKIDEGKEKIKEGEEKIGEADELITKLLDPQYTITEGLVSSSASSVLKSADGVVGLSNIFSIFFFVIAILVSLTSMTRMVDESRIQIGTLKALGYGNYQISKKYFYYGFLASFLGGILGIFLGMKVISPLVFNAYLSPFDFKKVDNFRYGFILIAGVLLSVITTSFSAYLACNKSLKEKISLLMRAKIPKGGNTVFVERFTSLWKELSFLFKITLRNIFRYKIRLVMTILGVTGCMALLVLGFGIKDSISGVSSNQFGKYTKYHIITNYNPVNLEKNIEKFNEEIKKDKRIKDSYDLTMLKGSLKTDFDVETDVAIMTIDDYEKFKNFYTMYENGKEIKELEDGVYINEKISEKLKLKKGDNISFVENNSEHTYKISGIFENHLGNYIVMNSKVHENIFAKRQVKNSKLIILENNTEEELKSLTKDLKEKEIVFNASDITFSKKILDNLLESVNIIVLVMIVCSGFLSMVVLYNLSNINISERKREIATLKVLGFYPKEVSSYVYRETIILTFFGIILGIFVGKILHKNILRELSTDSVKFFEVVSINSYVIATLITFFFVFLIYFLVKLILRKINMIESLKDVE